MIKYFFMMDEHPHKYCQACGTILKGRTDKKFCNDFCRNRYHNQHRPSSDMLIRKINQVLLQNRRIIENMMPGGEEMVRVGRDQLLQEGFRFSHLTHERKNNRGATYRYCYDYGYLTLDDQWVVLVKKREQDP